MPASAPSGAVSWGREQAGAERPEDRQWCGSAATRCRPNRRRFTLGEAGLAANDARPKPHASEGVTPAPHRRWPTGRGKIEGPWLGNPSIHARSSPRTRTGGSPSLSNWLPAPHQGLTDNPVRAFGLIFGFEPVGYDGPRDAAGMHVAQAAGRSGRPRSRGPCKSTSNGAVVYRSGPATGPAASPRHQEVGGDGADQLAPRR